MTAPNDINSWWGRDVADRHGDKIGTVDEVYLDPTTGEPTWVAIKTGLLGTHSSLAPLAGASVAATHITVGFDKDAVKNVPDVITDDELTPQDEDRLYHYYRLDRPTPTTPQEPAPDTQPPATTRDRDEPATSGPRQGGRGSALGAAFGEAARTIGHAASREVREARETFAQRREHDRRDATTPTEPRTEPRTDRGTTGPDTARHAEQNVPARPESGDVTSEVIRIRRHVVTEHLSATGEVLKRETHTEEDNPDQR